ncbi:MAG TPA: hypothetical protein VGP03_13960, partial [Pseudonocardiaceae bacterium]|nr:hypothetical protein [Pseudonocardiaceae bacterium]
RHRRPAAGHRQPEASAAQAAQLQREQALALVRDNQAVHVEDLHIAWMVHNRWLARAVHDAGWAQFVRLLQEKADLSGVRQHPRPGPQRRDQHPRRRACGEAKRPWSPYQSSPTRGSG